MNVQQLINIYGVGRASNGRSERVVKIQSLSRLAAKVMMPDHRVDLFHNVRLNAPAIPGGVGGGGAGAVLVCCV